MKKILTLIVIFVLLLIPFSPLKAQETNSTQYFDITLERDGQSAFGKGVTYTINITPKLDSPDTQITWDAPTSIEIKAKHSEFVELYRGQTYSYKAVVKPSRAGNYEISVSVIAWKNDINYTNSVSDIISFSDNLVTIPVDPGYTYGSIAKILIILLLCGIGTWGAIWGSKKGISALKQWLTPPN